MERIDTDILIAGGGVAGLTAMASFAEAGFSCLCVDPVPPVTDDAADGADLRSTAFLQPAIDVFREAGVWPQLQADATPLEIMRLIDAGGEDNIAREQADFAASEIGQDAFGANIPNWQIRRTLLAHLEQRDWVTLLAPASVTRITARTSHVLAMLSSGQQVRAKLLIAADGRNSFVRQNFDIPVRTWRYGQKALVFAVTHETPHQNVSTEIHRTGGPFTLVPLPDRDDRPASAVVWMETGPEAAQLMDMTSDNFAAAATARSCGVQGPLTLVGKRAMWPIISQLAAQLDGPRTALIAEAAHVVPPIGAQGLNMSLTDITCLRDLMIWARDADKDIGSPGLLRRYHRARHADIALRVTGIDALNRAAMAQAPGLRDLRRRGLQLLSGTAPVKRTVMSLGLGAKGARA